MDMRVTTKRPAWNDTFLDIAHVISARSTCPRLQVGSVIATSDNAIISTGYNGAARWQQHCTDVGCLMEDGHCIRSIHSEANAVVQGARLGISLMGCVLYTTNRPCYRCASMIVQAGIKYVVYESPYNGDEMEKVFRMFAAANIDCYRWDRETRTAIAP